MNAIRTPEVDEWGRQKASGQAYTAELTGKDKIVDRLKKLLELSKSVDEKEAATVSAKLHSMLREHNLEIADLETRGAKAKAEVGERGHDLGKAAFKWKLDLAEGIAKFYYCHPIVNRRAKTVQFVGRPENVEALTMTYQWVIEQVKGIATIERRAHYDRTQEHIDPLRWQLGFGEGAVERLVERMEEMKARQEEDMTRDEFGAVTGLALHHEAELSDYLEREHGFRTDGKMTEREREREARWQAYVDARQKEREEKDAFRLRCEESGDMTEYYAKYPDEHPDAVAKRQAESEKEMAAWRKREARNERRRRGGAWRPEKEEDIGKIVQQQSARESGRSNAHKVNLQPFIEGGGPKGKKGEIGG